MNDLSIALPNWKGPESVIPKTKVNLQKMIAKIGHHDPVVLTMP